METQRILSNVSKCPKSNCWNWARSVNSAGYGQLTENKQYWLAHRYSYVAHGNTLEPDQVLRHICHNPKCVNPEHLIPGTSKENYWDSRDKYLETYASRSKTWNIAGITYNSCREACNKTGLPISTLLKHTNNGVFDTDRYRDSCKKANKIPKL